MWVLQHLGGEVLDAAYSRNREGDLLVPNRACRRQRGNGPRLVTAGGLRSFIVYGGCSGGRRHWRRNCRWRRGRLTPHGKRVRVARLRLGRHGDVIGLRNSLLTEVLLVVLDVLLKLLLVSRPLAVGERDLLARSERQTVHQLAALYGYRSHIKSLE